MKCYAHADRDAVGTCRHCCKGVCAACAKDSGYGLVCSPSCEQEVQNLRGITEKNRKMLPIAAKTHLRNAIWLMLMAAIFIVFGLIQREGGYALFLLALGTVILLGAGFSALNSRRLKKLQS